MEESHVWITVSYKVTALEAVVLEQLFQGQIEIERDEKSITASIKYHDDDFETVRDWHKSFTRRLQLLHEAVIASWSLIKDAEKNYRKEEELARAQKT